MGELPEAPAPPKTDAEYEAELEAMLAEMQRMDERSDRTWEEIDRLKAESEATHTSSDDIAARIDRRLDAIFRLLEQMQHDRKLDQLRHENLILRLDNVLLRFERRLPPGAPPDELNSEPS